MLSRRVSSLFLPLRPTRSLLHFVVIAFDAKEYREQASQPLLTRFLHYPLVHIRNSTKFLMRNTYHRVGRSSVFRTSTSVFQNLGSSYPTHTKKRARTLESLTRATVLCESVKGQPQTPFAFPVSGTSQNRQTFSFAPRRKVSSTLCYRLR